MSGRAGRIRLVAPRTIPNRRLGQLEETLQSVSVRVRTDVSWSRFLDIKSEAMTASDRRPSNACTEVRRVPPTGRDAGPAAGERPIAKIAKDLQIGESCLRRLDGSGRRRLVDRRDRR